MSPVFTPDFASVEASIPIYEKGRYQLLITNRKPFAKQVEKDGNISDQSGVRYALEMVGQFDDDGELDTEKKGKQVSSNTVWLHTEKAFGMGKQFLMAACGYARNQEQEANADLFQGDDIEWDHSGDYDAAPETFVLGNGWDIPVDKLVDVSMWKDVTTSEDGNTTYENQKFGGWTPVN